MNDSNRELNLEVGLESRT